ncbi:MAG: hypothetical protein Q9191_002924 [Dirinaria sp. TL-2023a]
MPYPDHFEGFMIQSQDKWTDFKKQEFKVKPFGPRDVDIKIDACGVCGSDVHTINGGWGDAPMPLCVGHEVIGKAIKVGEKVSTVKVGDRVGVGAQIGSCLECKNCNSDNENYCPHQVDTYGAPWPDSGVLSQGGYSSHIRAHEYFTFPIPNAISTEEAAPMMCAGLTTYSPLLRAGTGPGKKVAIVGVGGLGHFGILWAAAMGAEVYAISHSPNKKNDALALGAKEFISSGEKDWAKPWAFTFNFILNCADMTHHFNVGEYMSTLAVNGTFHNVGVPDGPLPQLTVNDYMANGCSTAASHIGSRPEMLKMLKLAVDKNLHPIVETLPIGEKGCAEAVQRVDKNQVRYRFTLTDYDKAFPDRK